MARFRRVPPARHERYQQLLDYAFDAESGPQTYEDGLPDRLGERWGLFDNDELVTTCTLYGFDTRVRGEWMTIGGLAAVASSPEHRREGNVREMITDAIREYRDRGIGWIALWPFDYGFYRQLGWGTANKFSKYEFAPEALSFAADYDDGHFERIDADDWERLRPVQLAHGEGTTLSRRRSEDWWRERVFDYWGETPYVYAWVRDEEVRGYIVYTIREEDDERTFRVIDLSHVDHEAYLHLLRFIHVHESQTQHVELYRSEETALLDQVDDPRAVTCTVDTGPMIRLGDVRSALSRHPYPEDVTERVVLDVTDPLCRHNDITVALTVTDQITDCSWSKLLPEGRVDVSTLSQLAVGYLDAEDARRYGGLDCDDETVQALSNLFPPERVCLREFF